VTGFATFNPKQSAAAKALADKLYTGKPEDFQDWWGHPFYWAGLQIWKQAIEKAGTLNKADVRQALVDLKMPQIIEARKDEMISFTKDFRESIFDLWMEQLSLNATIGESRPTIVWPDNLKTTDFVLPSWYVAGSSS